MTMQVKIEHTVGYPSMIKPCGTSIYRRDQSNIAPVNLQKFSPIRLQQIRRQ